MRKEEKKGNERRERKHQCILFFKCGTNWLGRSLCGDVEISLPLYITLHYFIGGVVE